LFVTVHPSFLARELSNTSFHCKVLLLIINFCFYVDIQRSVELKHLKLTYEGPSCPDDAGGKWDKLLSMKGVQVDPFLLQQAIRTGNFDNDCSISERKIPVLT